MAGILEDFHLCQLRALACEQRFALFAQAGTDGIEYRYLLPCHDLPPVGARIGLGDQLIGRAHGHLQRRPQYGLADVVGRRCPENAAGEVTQVLLAFPGVGAAPLRTTR